jgi:hypothetical protein
VKPDEKLHVYHLGKENDWARWRALATASMT